MPDIPTPVPPGPAPAIPVGIQTLAETPDETGYAVVENQDSLLNADLDGGPPRTRLDVIGGGRIITVQWSGQAKRWQKVRDFLNQNVALNCPKFNLDLIIETADYQTYQCNVVPGSIKSSTPVGRYWVVQATLDVSPLDYAAIDWPTGGGGGGGAITLFDDEFSGGGYSPITGHTPDSANGSWIGSAALFSSQLLISSDFDSANIDVIGASFPANKTITVELSFASEGGAHPRPGWNVYFNNNALTITSTDGINYSISDDNVSFAFSGSTVALIVALKLVFKPASYSIFINSVAVVNNAAYSAHNTFADGDSLTGLSTGLNGGECLTDYVRVSYSDPT